MEEKGQCLNICIPCPEKWLIRLLGAVLLAENAIMILLICFVAIWETVEIGKRQTRMMAEISAEYSKIAKCVYKERKRSMHASNLQHFTGKKRGRVMQRKKNVKRKRVHKSKYKRLRGEYISRIPMETSIFANQEKKIEKYEVWFKTKACDPMICTVEASDYVEAIQTAKKKLRNSGIAVLALYNCLKEE